MYIDNEPLQTWLKTGEAHLVPADVAADFGHHLRELPWSSSGSGLDWTQISNVSANLSALSKEELVSWLHSTAFRSDSVLVFWFGPNEPCIACEAPFAISRIDQAFWTAPGRRHIFGANFSTGLRPEFTHVAEYDGADRLIAMS